MQMERNRMVPPDVESSVSSGAESVVFAADDDDDGNIDGQVKFATLPTEPPIVTAPGYPDTTYSYQHTEQSEPTSIDPYHERTSPEPYPYQISASFETKLANGELGARVSFWLLLEERRARRIMHQLELSEREQLNAALVTALKRPFSKVAAGLSAQRARLDKVQMVERGTAERLSRWSTVSKSMAVKEKEAKAFLCQHLENSLHTTAIARSALASDALCIQEAAAREAMVSESFKEKREILHAFMQRCSKTLTAKDRGAFSVARKVSAFAATIAVKRLRCDVTEALLRSDVQARRDLLQQRENLLSERDDKVTDGLQRIKGLHNRQRALMAAVARCEELEADVIASCPAAAPLSPARAAYSESPSVHNDVPQSVDVSQLPRRRREPMSSPSLSSSRPTTSPNPPKPWRAGAAPLPWMQSKPARQLPKTRRRLCEINRIATRAPIPAHDSFTSRIAAGAASTPTTSELVQCETMEVSKWEASCMRQLQSHMRSSAGSVDVCQLYGLDHPSTFLPRRTKVATTVEEMPRSGVPQQSQSPAAASLRP